MDRLIFIEYQSEPDGPFHEGVQLRSDNKRRIVRLRTLHWEADSQACFTRPAHWTIEKQQYDLLCEILFTAEGRPRLWKDTPRVTIGGKQCYLGKFLGPVKLQVQAALLADICRVYNATATRQKPANFRDMTLWNKVSRYLTMTGVISHPSQLFQSIAHLVPSEVTLAGMAIDFLHPAQAPWYHFPAAPADAHVHGTAPRLVESQTPAPPAAVPVRAATATIHHGSAMGPGVLTGNSGSLQQHCHHAAKPAVFSRVSQALQQKSAYAAPVHNPTAHHQVGTAAANGQQQFQLQQGVFIRSSTQRNDRVYQAPAACVQENGAYKGFESRQAGNQWGQQMQQPAPFGLALPFAPFAAGRQFDQQLQQPAPPALALPRGPSVAADPPGPGAPSNWLPDATVCARQTGCPAPDYQQAPVTLDQREAMRPPWLFAPPLPAIAATGQPAHAPAAGAQGIPHGMHAAAPMQAAYIMQPAAAGTAAVPAAAQPDPLHVDSAMLRAVVKGYICPGDEVMFTETADSSPQSQLGWVKLQVVQNLGMGGNGAVFLGAVRQLEGHLATVLPVNSLVVFKFSPHLLWCHHQKRVPADMAANCATSTYDMFKEEYKSMDACRTCRNTVHAYGLGLLQLDRSHTQLPAVLLEYCGLGSWGDLMFGGSPSIIKQDAATVHYIVKEVLEAVLFMADRSILHRDIKPANILLQGSSLGCCAIGAPPASAFASKQEAFPFMVKLGDFGCARMKRGGVGTTQCGIGTLPYLPPEVPCQEKTNHNMLVDVWGLVMSFLAARTGVAVPFRCLGKPFDNLPYKEALQIAQERLEQLPAMYGAVLTERELEFAMNGLQGSLALRWTPFQLWSSRYITLRPEDDAGSSGIVPQQQQEPAALVAAAGGGGMMIGCQQQLGAVMSTSERASLKHLLDYIMNQEDA